MNRIQLSYNITNAEAFLFIQSRKEIFIIKTSEEKSLNVVSQNVEMLYLLKKDVTCTRVQYISLC